MEDSRGGRRHAYKSAAPSLSPTSGGGNTPPCGLLPERKEFFVDDVLSFFYNAGMMKFEILLSLLPLLRGGEEDT